MIGASGCGCHTSSCALSLAFVAPHLRARARALFFSLCSDLPADLPAELPVGLPAELPAELPACDPSAARHVRALSAHHPAHLPAELSPHHPAHLPAELPTCVRVAPPPSAAMSLVTKRSFMSGLWKSASSMYRKKIGTELSSHGETPRGRVPPPGGGVELGLG